jgi:hypothetical protein
LRPGRRSRASAIQSASPIRPACPDDDAPADLEVLDQGVQHPARNPVFDFEEREHAVPLLFQAAVDHRHEVFALVLRDHERRIPEHAEQVRARHRDTGKQLAEVEPDHILEQREAVALVALRRERHEARQRVGTLTRANLVRPRCSTTTARLLLRLEM